MIVCMFVNSAGERSGGRDRQPTKSLAAGAGADGKTRETGSVSSGCEWGARTDARAEGFLMSLRVGDYRGLDSRRVCRCVPGQPKLRVCMKLN